MCADLSVPDGGQAVNSPNDFYSDLATISHESAKIIWRQHRIYKAALQYLRWGMWYETQNNPELAEKIKAICDAVLVHEHDFSADLFGPKSVIGVDPCQCELCRAARPAEGGSDE